MSDVSAQDKQGRRASTYHVRHSVAGDGHTEKGQLRQPQTHFKQFINESYIQISNHIHRRHRSFPH